MLATLSPAAPSAAITASLAGLCVEAGVVPAAAVIVPATVAIVPAPAAAVPQPAPVAHGYSSDSYWNDRYSGSPTHFDWFFTHAALAPLLREACSPDAGPCLHVGCGNSNLSDGMARSGYQVVNVDISDVVIEQMRQMHTHPGQAWEVADCRSMPQYADASFASVLDKGTLDAVLCSGHSVADTALYLDEVHRLLSPGGTFLLISLAQPGARLAALNAAPQQQQQQQQQQQLASGSPPPCCSLIPGSPSAAARGDPTGTEHSWNWDSVRVYLLPKPALYLASEQSLSGRPVSRRSAATDKDTPVAWLGPYMPGHELDSAVEAQGLDLREFFTAFACTKSSSPSAAAAALAVAEPHCTGGGSTAS